MEKWRSLLLLSLSVMFTAYADPEVAAFLGKKLAPPACPTVTGSEKQQCPNYAIPCPAVYESVFNTYGFGEFLFWKMHEDGLAWASSQTASFDALSVSPATAEPNWSWNPGFRVGAGYVFAKQDWDLSLAYTWYRAEAKSSKSFVEETNVAFGLFDTNSSAGGDAKWHFFYNTLELALKQPFFIGTKTILNPGLALFGAYTSDKYTIDNTIAGLAPRSSNQLNLKQFLYCIGPKASIDSVWKLTDCLSIVGEGSIAFLWGHYHNTRLDVHFNGATEVHSIFTNLKNTFDTLRLVPFYSVGINWNQPISTCNGNYYVYFKAAWEQQIWLQYNQFFLLNVNNDNTLAFNNTNLSLYGLTLSTGVQF